MPFRAAGCSAMSDWAIGRGAGVLNCLPFWAGNARISLEGRMDAMIPRYRTIVSKGCQRYGKSGKSCSKKGIMRLVCVRQLNRTELQGFHGRRAKDRSSPGDIALH